MSNFLNCECINQVIPIRKTGGLHLPKTIRFNKNSPSKNCYDMVDDFFDTCQNLF